MKTYLVSNNLLVDGLNYDANASLELIRMVRPISSEGENIAEKISNIDALKNIDVIYSSYYSSALSTAKYLANKLEMNIELVESLNDCKVGSLGSKNMKMVKGLQDHDFNYKLPNGESLIDVGDRLNHFLNSVSTLNRNCAIFTHKRTILGYLLKYAKVGYNLDENLILEYNGKIIYDDSDTDFDIYEITWEKGKIVDIKSL